MAYQDNFISLIEMGWEGYQPDPEDLAAFGSVFCDPDFVSDEKEDRWMESLAKESEEEAHILELGERYAPDSEADDLGNTESSAEWQPL